MSPPFSLSRSKPSKKPALSRLQAQLDEGVIHQKTELFLATVIGTSNFIQIRCLGNDG
jgi:hypothetical protein